MCLSNPIHYSGTSVVVSPAAAENKNSSTEKVELRAEKDQLLTFEPLNPIIPEIQICPSSFVTLSVADADVLYRNRIRSRVINLKWETG